MKTKLKFKIFVKIFEENSSENLELAVNKHLDEINDSSTELIDIKYSISNEIASDRDNGELDSVYSHDNHCAMLVFKHYYKE